MSQITLPTAIHYYKFDTSSAEQLAAWEKLKKELKATPGRGHRLNVMETQPARTKAPGTSETVELETVCLFNNQWNTAAPDDRRVFDWYEGINFDNRALKFGHYLDITPEMREIRRNTMTCGYCGKHEPAAKGYVFCPHCLGSEYLKEADLYMLRMLPVDEHHAPGIERAPLTEAEHAHLLPLFIEAQTTCGRTRNNKRAAQKRADIEEKCIKDQQDAQTERDGFIWLLDHDVNIDNCIFYTHTQRFGFGWRSPVGDTGNRFA